MFKKVINSNPKLMEKKLVYIESPFKGKDWSETARNVYYARLCVRNSLLRGETPYASHLFFTQTGILSDAIPEERMLGILAGQAIGDKFDLRAIYEDFGISRGMKFGIKRAQQINQPIDYRKLSEKMNLDEELCKISKIKPSIDLGSLLF